MNCISYVKKACDVCRISTQEFFLESGKQDVMHARVMVIKAMTNKGYDISDLSKLLMFELSQCKKWLKSFEFRYAKEEYFRNKYHNYLKKIL